MGNYYMLKLLKKYYKAICLFLAVVVLQSNVNSYAACPADWGAITYLGDGAGGGTYSRIFPNSIPYGPCELSLGNQRKYGGPHAANEAVSIDLLMQGLKVYVIALQQLDEYFTRNKRE